MGIEELKPDIFSAYLIFPFAFDNSKIQVKKLAKALQKDPLKNWQASDYEIKLGKDYNEYLYFYRYARDILFSSKKANPKDFYFLKWKQNNLSFRIFSTQENSTMEIDIEDIYLHLYDFGVGVLIFELHDENLQLNSKKNIQYYLRILNLARRLYPPFVRKDLDFENIEIDKIDSINCGECPQRIGLYENQKNPIMEHDYQNDNRWETNEPQRQIPSLSKIITFFLDTKSQGLNFSYENESYWSIVDDRMFIHSFYRLPTFETANNRFLEELQIYFNHEDSGVLNLESLDYLYQMIFIDVGSSSCPNITDKKKHLNKAVYTRWINPVNIKELSPTIYGFSRFSSVMITTVRAKEDVENQNDFSQILLTHFGTMYYQMAVLLFFYRGTLLVFSRRSAKIVKLFQKGIQKTGKELLERLQKEFLLFRNRFWFKEVTGQDQGIEMFQKWAEQLKIFELMEDIKSEISELYEYVRYVNEQKENWLLRIITLVGAIFLPITVITGFFGMNLFDKNNPLYLNIFDFSRGWLWFWLAISVLYIIIFFIFIYYKLKRD